ncbi:MAG: HAD family hydrolase [Clostridia bacterium]|nr:HAD family hydrolase [Clostridia bacterium]
MKIRTAIFDLDGTLLDTLGGLEYYLNSVLADEGAEPITLEMTREFIGNGARKLLERTCASRGITDAARVEVILEKYKKRYDSDPFRFVEPYEDISALIDALRARGIKLAVLSNKPQFATVAMVEHFFPEKFDVVRGGVEGIALKPTPDAARLILDELGSSADECALIGDGETDVEAAKNLGAALQISVLWGFRTREQLEDAGAVNFVTAPKEILDLLNE